MTDSRLFDGRRGQGPEVVADRLCQPRLIHLPFHAGDNRSFNFDPALLFHKATSPRTMSESVHYRTMFGGDPIFTATTTFGKLPVSGTSSMLT